MKYNLRNRPDKDLIQPELWQWVKWAEGLEAELREVYDECESCLNDSHALDYPKARAHCVIQFIKEILGE